MDDFVKGLGSFVLALIILSFPVLLALSIVFKCTGLVIWSLLILTIIDVLILSAMIDNYCG